MTAPILVTGGTGTLGKRVVPRLRGAGYDVRVLSRHARPAEAGITYVAGDLATGEGVPAAVEGVHTVLHLAGTPKGDEVKARTLVESLQQAGAPHLVHISVVGAERLPVVSAFDRMAFGYYAAKRAAEVVVEESGLPFSTLRATQFHDLLLTMARGMAKLPVIPVAGFRFQPVETDEVAARLVELVLDGPSGLVAELAGPEVLTMEHVVRSYLEATGRHRLTMPVRMPGKAARAMREGANLSADNAVGKKTWEQFLAESTGG